MKVTKSTSDRRGFILSSIFFLCCLSALVWIKEFQFEAVSKFGKFAFKNTESNTLPTSSPKNDTKISSRNDVRVLVGILTLPDQYQRRNFLRMVYGVQKNPTEDVKFDVKFVFCNLTKDDQRVLVALEIMRYDDIIILDCKENMNNGKTYTYFSSLPEMLNDTNRPYPPYHYVMKADDDIYIRLENFARSLKTLPREDLYYGYVIPCSSTNPFVRYMAGMGYLVSWDLVEWIRDSEIPRNNLKGPEDKVFGDWLRDGHKAKNRFNAKWSMYDIHDPPTGCTHEFWPETIAVHKLKNQEKWIRTLNYFNVTQDLKPSKLYHIS